jgi:hypothetical protein
LSTETLKLTSRWTSIAAPMICFVMSFHLISVPSVSLW